MNNHFSLKRTWQLICGQWSESRKFYLYGTMALLGVIIFTNIMWIFFAGGRSREDTLVLIYIVGLLLLGAIFANHSFKMLHSKAESINWFTVPASQGEKLICVLFYNVIVFTAVYTLCYVCISYCSISYIKNIVRNNPVKYSYTPTNWNDPNEIAHVLNDFIYIFFIVQGLFILGSVYFKKYSFILTTIITVLLFFTFLFYIQKLSDFFGDSAIFKINELKVYNPKLTNYQLSSIDNPFANTIFFLFKFIWAPFLWLVTWYRLKEKEI